MLFEVQGEPPQGPGPTEQGRRLRLGQGAVGRQMGKRLPDRVIGEPIQPVGLGPAAG